MTDKTLPLLMTAENPDGWKLEELLEKLREELASKTDNLQQFGDLPAACKYRAANADLCRLFTVAEGIQRDALAFAARNPLVKK